MLSNLPALTDAIQKTICAYIRHGASRKIAAKLVGVSPQTLRHWMICGKQGTEPYVQFRLAVLNAEATAEAGMVSILFRAASVNVAYARWWLERKCPRHWSKNGRLLRLEKSVKQLADIVRTKLRRQGGTTASAGSASAGAQRQRFDDSPKRQD
jgi:transposase-like protein